MLAVMRIHGSLRVILNTKIWSGMSVEQASSKAIRFSATDCDQTIRVFLFMVNYLKHSIAFFMSLLYCFIFATSFYPCQLPCYPVMIVL